MTKDKDDIVKVDGSKFQRLARGHVTEIPKCKVRVEIFGESDPFVLEQVMNKFISSLDARKFLDVRLGSLGLDHYSAMVMYEE